MTDQQRDAIEALKKAAEEFDQACAELRDVGLYDDGISYRTSDVSAEDINATILPALIKHLTRAAQEQATEFEELRGEWEREQIDAELHEGRH